MYGSTYHNYASVLINLVKCFIKTKNKFGAERTIALAKLHRTRMMKLTKGKRFFTEQNQRNDSHNFQTEKTNLNESMASLANILKTLERQVRKVNPPVSFHQRNGVASVNQCDRVVPYEGFTSIYPKIKNASVACSLMYANHGTYDRQRNFDLIYFPFSYRKNQILANRTVPADEVILYELPVVTERLNSDFQCSVCHNKSQNLISYVEYAMCWYSNELSIFSVISAATNVTWSTIAQSIADNAIINSINTSAWAIKLCCCRCWMPNSFFVC